MDTGFKIIRKWKLMNYIEWANNYLETANKCDDIINRLIISKKHINDPIEKLSIDNKISQFYSYREECMKTAKVLFEIAECKE